MAANKQTQAEVIKNEVIKNKAQQTHESEELSDEDLESVAGGRFPFGQLQPTNRRKSHRIFS